MSEDNECRKPCDPDVGCADCADYWERMQREGYWDGQKHQWTARGMKEMRK